MKNRLLDIDGVINFRDLGGYLGAGNKRVVWRKLYRAAQFDRLTESGIQQTQALNIQTVVDLRFSDETERYPTVRQAFPVADFISWESELDKTQRQSGNKIRRSWKDSLSSGDAAKVREAMRVNYPAKLYSHRGVYREMLMRLTKQQSPIVFHCAAGKDRTGVAAALILGLLGVSEDDIVEDYLITNGQVAHLIDTWVGGGAATDQNYDDFQSQLAQYPREVVQPVFDADMSYISTLLEYVRTTYGEFQNYARDVLGLDDQQLDALRLNLLA